MFAEKIAVGRKAALTDEFMIIGRIESLILGVGMEDALVRARAYVAAGANGIMIHSRRKTPDEIFEFCDKFRKADPDTTIVVVPTQYSVVRESELIEHGVNIVIYANHLLRASFPAMRAVGESILRNGRAMEADDICLPVDELLGMIPNTVS